MDPKPPKELCLIIPGRGDPSHPVVLRRQNLCSSFLPCTRCKIRLSKSDLEEVVREYRPIIAFALSHKGGGNDGSGPSKEGNYNDKVFRRAAALSGPFLRYSQTLFLFHEPFESMIDQHMQDKFRALTFPVLDEIHKFSDKYQIPSSRIIYMVIEGGDTHKKPYDLYYEEHPDLEPVRFIYYPSLETKTAEHFYRNSEDVGGREIVSSCGVRTRKFTYLNNAPRAPRVALCAELWNRGILDSDWYWSFLQPNGGSITNYPDFCEAMPKILDVETVVEGTTVRILTPGDHGDAYRFFNDSYISLVSETTTGNARHQMDGAGTHVFLTEKTFKCFFFQHPFIIWAYPRTLREIRKLGYQTFSPWINEDYDEIEDYHERMAAIIEEVQRLKAMALPRLQKMRQEMQHILDYNSEHFKFPNIQARNLHYFQREINKAVY